MTTKDISVAFMILILALGVASVTAPASADQDDEVVRIDGRVQWIGGQQMVVQANTGRSVGVDLTSVPQDEYLGLNVRDKVAVIGTVSPDGRRFLGTSILRIAGAR